MANCLVLAGIGQISWTLEKYEDSEVQNITDGYYVPQVKARLLTFQHIFNKKMELKGYTKVMKINSLSNWMVCQTRHSIHFSSGLPIL